ncbi:hypothetical protein BH09DEP1_BH09DEP1_7600 [soil metagenome]
MISRFLVLALFLTSFLACADAPYNEGNDVICPTKENCSITSECKCWCSHKCGPREKVKDDKPVFFMSDPYGHYCYCNEWDVKNIDRCNVKNASEDAPVASNIISIKK